MEEQTTKRKKGKPFRTPETIERDNRFALFIAEIITRKQAELGLNDREFAKLLDVSRSRVCHIKKASGAVSESLAHRLLKSVGIKSAFYAGEEEFIYPNEK